MKNADIKKIAIVGCGRIMNAHLRRLEFGIDDFGKLPCQHQPVFVNAVILSC